MNSVQTPLRLNSILFNGPYLIKDEKDGQVSSPFPFIVEEMIANGAISVKVPGWGEVLPSELNRIPKASRSQFEMKPPPDYEFLSAPLQKRIEVIPSAEVQAQSQAILTPGCDELGVQYLFPTLSAFQLNEKKLAGKALEAFKCVNCFLPTFLLGLEYQVQVFFDVQKMRDSISYLQSYCRSSDARGNLACLSGILSNYEPVTVGYAQVTSTGQALSLETFEEFLSDLTYQSISRQSHLLGYPDKVKQSTLRLRGMFKKLLSKPSFKHIFNYTSKIVSVATSLPIPNSEIAEAILKSKFLPPALPVSAWFEISQTAHDRWSEN